MRLVKKIMPVVKKKENRFPDSSQVNWSSLAYYYRIVCTRQGLQTSTARTSYSETCRPLTFPSSYFLYWWHLSHSSWHLWKYKRFCALICTRPPWRFYLMNVDSTPTRPHLFILLFCIFYFVYLLPWCLSDEDTPKSALEETGARRTRKSKNKRTRKKCHYVVARLLRRDGHARHHSHLWRCFSARNQVS